MHTVQTCYKSSACAVHQVNVPISHVSEAFKPFSTVLIRDGVESVLCETFPDNELETNEIQIHPFTKTLLFDTILSLEPIQTSINATKITLQLHNAEPNAVKSLEHMDKHISNINSLFAKPFNEQWLQPMIRRRLLHQRVVQNAIIPISLSGYNYAFRVTSIEPQTNTAIVDASTELVVNLVKHTEADITEGIQELSLSEDKHVLLWNKVAQQIGGLDEQIQELVTLLDSILLEQIPNIPRTILIHGVQGTGKTLLTKLLCDEYKRHGVHVKAYEGSDLKTMMKELEILPSEPTLVCIQDLEIMCNRNESYDQLQSLAFMHQLLQRINSSSNIAFIGTSSNIDMIDDTIRTHNRIAKDVYIPVPNLQQKRKIIQIVAKRMNIQTDEIDRVNNYTPGFVGRDIERLFKMAMIQKISTNAENVEFGYALRVVKPSQTIDLGESTKSTISWEQFAGYEQIATRCKELMYWPLQSPESFERFGLPLSCGILLYGPSGCGKTMLIKALSSLGGMSYVSIKCPELFSKYTGETEASIRNLFRRARQLEPCVLVFDEIDAIAPSRESDSGGDGGSAMRALSQLLNEMDGIQSRKNVFIVGCTNRLESIDSAVTRPGRLDQLIKMDFPTSHDRSRIFESCFKFGQQNKAMPVSASVDVKVLVERTKGKTGADVSAICREAALIALRQDMSSSEITMEHFEKAIK